MKAESGEGAKAPVKKAEKKHKEVAAHGAAHITATYNNTIISLTDGKGNVISWSSAGKCGFKGPKKSTAYAAGVVVKDVVTKAFDMGLREVEVFIKGVGAGREAAVRALNTNGLSVLTIKDVTPIPHNGPRPRKVRRV
ncbi:30S ribosomal protein S11 [Candidatus Uhrbacteria bacterium]|nr:30S ribosomal protein S11 [Candidatus Uhrbacteria bacterium]